ncbi:MAG: SUMF1/EgtB/PvdO family nonheme iron enzyme [Planctomycetes bacterium]|nr:SUMF1/EgtB/PvdO family nonheme iron enzyme [Planctomycetota bacterium]
MTATTNDLFLRFRNEQNDGDDLVADVVLVEEPSQPRDLLACRIPMAVLHASIALQQNPHAYDSAFRVRLGRDLWGCLPEPIRRRLEPFRGSPLRLFVDFTSAPTIQLCAFELLAFEHKNQVHLPIQTSRWQLLRCPDAMRLVEPTPAVDSRIRVLVLCGSQEQPPLTSPAEPALTDTVREITEALAGPQSPFHVTVAATEPMLAHLDTDAVVDHVLMPHSDPAERTRRVLDLLSEASGFDVVHFIGHSDARPKDARAGGARALCFEFLPGVPADAIPIEEFAGALAHTRARLVVLNACLSRELLAEPLLQHVDSVVGMAAMLWPWFCPGWCGAFYRALAADLSVGQAVDAARTAIRGFEDADPRLQTAVRELPWVPTLWTRVRAAVPFRDEKRRLRREYLQRVIEAHQDLHGGLLARHAEAIEHVPVEVSIAHQDRHGSRKEFDADESKRGRKTPTVATLLTEAPRRFAVLGKPGSGKTTSLRYLARTLAREALADRSAPLPVFVRLPRWVKDESSAATADVLDYVLRQLRFDDPADRAALAEILGQAGREGRVAVLLDGLDEVASVDHQAIHGLLDGVFTNWRLAPVLVTSRPFGYQNPHPRHLEEAELLPLFSHQQQELLAQWFRMKRLADPEQRAKDALAQIEKSPALAELAGTPLFLTLMAVQLERGVAATDLGFRRHEFLRQVIQCLLRGEHRPKGEETPLEPTDTALALLAFVGYRMVVGFELTASRRRVLQWLASEDNRLRPSLLQHWTEPGAFLDEVGQKTLLFRPLESDATLSRDDTEWDFLHRSLKEALCALHLEASCPDSATLNQRVAELEASLRGATPAGDGEGDDEAREQTADESDQVRSWAESLALLAGLLKERADQFVHRLLESEQLRRIGIEAVALADSLSADTLALALGACRDLDERRMVYAALGERGEAKAVELLATRAREVPREWEELYEIDNAVLRIADRNSAPIERLRAARDAVFAENRGLDVESMRAAFAEVPGRAGSTLWCRIEPGGFVMGSPVGEDGRDDDERQFRVALTRAFHIGAATITFGQFRLFDPQHTHRWGDRHRVAVTETSWFAAAMFCRWLTREIRRLRNVGEALGFLPNHGKLEVRLPTEAEWEYCARAGKTTRFWKGDSDDDLSGVGWFDENSEDRVREVASLEANPWGLHDVHGNVWEWCADWYGPYPEQATDDVEQDWTGPRSARDRVLRGGCYGLDAGRCRSASRDWSLPAGSSNVNGFRVVLAPAAPQRSSMIDL